MFTLEQIKSAHSKVKSGADFPNYVQELISLGVSSYEALVGNGKTIYYGNDNFVLEGEPKYDTLPIASTLNKEQFEQDLKAHQQGKTDFMTFCNDCAKSGIVKWILDFEKLTCVYYDLKNNEVLIEKIPA